MKKTKTKFLTTLFLVIFVIFIFGIKVSAQEIEKDYELLAPIPCVGGDCDSLAKETDLSKYIPGLFKLLVGLSAVAAVLMIVFGGFEYMSSDALMKKEAGKERMKNAIFGLIFVISAWLILNTINPKILNFDLNIENIQVKDKGSLQPVSTGDIVTEGVASSFTNVGIIIGTAKSVCPNCVFSPVSLSTYTNTKYPLKPEDLAKFSCQTCIPLDKSIGTNGETHTNVTPDTKSKIEKMNEELKKQNIVWSVSEAFPPTVHHEASCSYNGTCIDAVTNSSHPTINSFFEAAQKAGLEAVYEVKTEDEKKRLIEGGVKGTILVVPWATGGHFSVYNR